MGYTILHYNYIKPPYFQNILWQIGAFAVFFAWITLLMIIRKMPHFGVYVLMFTNVARSFLRVLVLFVLFLITFALTFHALLQNQVSRITFQTLYPAQF